MEYWIDGYFTRSWTYKAWYSHERGVYIPLYATITRHTDRIYITESFAKKILNKKKFDSTNRNDMFDLCLQKIINKPWKKEPYVEPEPQFRVSLP